MNDAIGNPNKIIIFVGYVSYEEMEIARRL